MKREDISQSDLARRLGIRSQAVNQWLQPDGTAPRGARLVAVAAALGVELSELLAETPEKLPSADQTRAELFAAIDAMNEEQRRALLTMVKVMAPQEKAELSHSSLPTKRRPAA